MEPTLLIVIMLCCSVSVGVAIYTTRQGSKKPPKNDGEEEGMSNTAIALIGSSVAIGGALFTIFFVVKPKVKGRDGDTRE